MADQRRRRRRGGRERWPRGLEALRARAAAGSHRRAPRRTGDPQRRAGTARGDGPRSLRHLRRATSHAEFMIANNYRSAVVVPLQARGRTLGAISILRLEPASRSAGEGPTAGGPRARLGSSRGEPRWRSTMPACSRPGAARAATGGDPPRRGGDHGDRPAASTIFANQAAADFGISTPGELTARPRERSCSLSRLDEQGDELDLERMPARRLFRDEHQSRCWCGTSSARPERSAG